MSDFCLSRPALSRVIRQAERMDRMLARSGVEGAVAARLDQGAAFYEARTRCIGCRFVVSCNAWLADAAAGLGGGARIPGFCPNGNFIDRARAASDAERADQQKLS